MMLTRTFLLLALASCAVASSVEAEDSVEPLAVFESSGVSSSAAEVALQLELAAVQKERDSLRARLETAEFFRRAGEEPDPHGNHSGDDDDDDDDEEEKFDLTTLTALFLSLSFLVVCTMIFEFFKEQLQEYATGASQPMVDALFAELTVLGFIGLIAFSLGQAGVLKNISKVIFGASDEEQEKLPELFEELHMILFLTMVIFIFEVVALMRVCNMQARKWCEAEQIANSPELLIQFIDQWEGALNDPQTLGKHREIKSKVRSALSVRQHNMSMSLAERWAALQVKAKQLGKHEQLKGWSLTAAHHNQKVTFEELHWTISYLALRAEFITPRAEPMSQNQKQPFDFDYSDYLCRILGETLGEIVEVPLSTWMCLELILGAFYILLYLTNSDMSIFAFIYAGFMYIPAVLSYVVSKKLSFIRGQLVSEPMMMQDLLRRRIIIVSAMERSLENDGDLEFSQQEYVDAMNKFNSGGSCVITEHHGVKGDPGTAETNPNASRAYGGGANAFDSSIEEAIGAKDALKQRLLAQAGESGNELSNAVAGSDNRLRNTAEAAEAADDEKGDWSRFLPPFLEGTYDDEAESAGCGGSAKSETVAWSQYICNGFTSQPPNPHQALFWFGRYGADLVHWFIRISLVLNAVYFPVQGILWMKNIIPYYNGTKDPPSGEEITTTYVVCYAIFCALPPLIMYPFITKLVTKQVHVTSVEMMVDKEMVNKVKLKMRTDKILRIMSMINRLRSQADLIANHTAMQAFGDDVDPEVVMQSMDVMRRREIERIFDHFDADNSDALDADELKMFLESLGQNPTTEDAERLCDALDADGNRLVSKSEFLCWIHLSEQNKAKPQTIKEVAEAMFDLFNADGDDKITQEEFKEKLESFGVALDESDFHTLMKELDPDGDGEITAEEFEDMLLRNDFQP